MDIAEQRQIGLQSVTEPLDTTSELGQVMTRMLVSFAQMESASNATRTRRAKRASAARGEPKHGGHRGFGHNRDGTAVETEASLIREAVGSILAGTSVSAIARSWAANGIRTPTGGAWQAGKLRRLLLQPRLAGARVLGDGEWVLTGAIKPIVSEIDLGRVRVLLLDPSRVTYRGRVHDSLLTGLLHCGLCGARMETHAVRGRRTYQCYSRPERHSCGRTAVTVSLADEHVAGLILTLIDIPAVRRALASPTDDSIQTLGARLMEDRQQLERVAILFYAERAISEIEYRAVRTRLDERIDEAQAALDRATSEAAAPIMIEQSIRNEWATLPIDTRRLIARTLVSKVFCDPARRPINVWNPDRLRVAYRTPLPDQADDLSDLPTTEPRLAVRP
jgi:hypothetical protein